MDNGALKGLLKRIKLSESTISKILGALVIVVIGVLIFNYFRGVEQTEEIITPGEVQLVEEEGQLVPEGLPVTHIVAEGEHLWMIAEKYYGSGYNWVDIANENNLTNPDQLRVGQELAIPRTAVIEPVTKTAFGPAITSDQYSVQEGDHLWGVAVRAYGDGYQWVKIASENGISDPNVIHPGSVLSLPR